MVLVLCISSDICTNFHEEILNGFQDMEQTRNYYMKNTKVHNSVKTESRVMVLFLCTLSDDASYLYKLL